LNRFYWSAFSASIRAGKNILGSTIACDIVPVNIGITHGINIVY